MSTFAGHELFCYSACLISRFMIKLLVLVFSAHNICFSLSFLLLKYLKANGSFFSPLTFATHSLFTSSIPVRILLKWLVGGFFEFFSSGRIACSCTEVVKGKNNSPSNDPVLNKIHVSHNHPANNLSLQLSFVLFANSDSVNELATG